MRAAGDAVLPRTTDDSINSKGAGAVVAMTVLNNDAGEVGKLKDCSSALSRMVMASVPAVTVLKLEEKMAVSSRQTAFEMV